MVNIIQLSVICTIVDSITLLYSTWEVVWPLQCVNRKVEDVAPDFEKSGGGCRKKSGAGYRKIWRRIQKNSGAGFRKIWRRIQEISGAGYRTSSVDAIAISKIWNFHAPGGSSVHHYLYMWQLCISFSHVTIIKYYYYYYYYYYYSLTHSDRGRC